MKHINIFFEIIFIFFIVLLFTSLFFLFFTDILKDIVLSASTVLLFLNSLYKSLISVYKYVIMFSLFLTFSFYYAFVDLKIFKVRNFIFAIIAVPVLICFGLYYFDHCCSGLTADFILAKFITPFSTYTYASMVYYPVKIYYLSFLVFIIIPGAILFNNKDWYLKTVFFMILYLMASLFIFKHFNKLLLNLLKNIDNLKGLPPSGEIILSAVYIPIGIYIFKLADSIRKIKSRIDLGKVKKIQH